MSEDQWLAVGGSGVGRTGTLSLKYARAWLDSTRQLFRDRFSDRLDDPAR